MAKYTYADIYQSLKASGAFDTSTSYTFTATFEIDLKPYQDAVLALDFKDFKDDQLVSDINAVAASPSLDQLIGVSTKGENSHIPNASDASIMTSADRVIINAKKDFGMLFGKKGVALASPNRVNIDAGQSITLYGHENVFLGIPNRGNRTKEKQPNLGPTKGHPTPDQEYDPLVLGYKLANLLEDILFVLKSAELVSGVSPVKFQPSTQAEFGLLANRIPEILSNYAFVDGISHEQIDKAQLETLKAQQKKVKKFEPPKELTANFTGTGTGVVLPGMPGSNSTPSDFAAVPSSVSPTSDQYILVEGGHGAYWPNGNPYTNKPDPRIAPGAGDALHAFTSDMRDYKETKRSMDTQVEAGLKEFKQKYNKPADVVGMVVQMNENAATKQVSWKVLIQESKNGIHYQSFRARGSAKSPDTSLTSTLQQINAGTESLKNFKKIYLFEHKLGGLLITQAFAIY